MKFGIAPVFKVEKHVKNVEHNSRGTRIGDTDTKVSILNFEWESYGKKVVLPPEK